MRTEFKVEGLSKPISHYTDAVRYGNLLFISGMPPFDEFGNVVGGDDVVAQTKQVFRNLKDALSVANASFSDILKVTVYLTDVADRVAINSVRQEYFGTTRPASTLIGVKELAVPGMKVEIDAIAGLKPEG